MRDLKGYGRTPPDPKWPGGARVAVSFVINFEEGAEKQKRGAWFATRRQIAEHWQARFGK